LVGVIDRWVGMGTRDEADPSHATNAHAHTHTRTHTHRYTHASHTHAHTRAQTNTHPRAQTNTQPHAPVPQADGKVGARAGEVEAGEPPKQGILHRLEHGLGVHLGWGPRRGGGSRFLVCCSHMFGAGGSRGAGAPRTRDHGPRPTRRHGPAHVAPWLAAINTCPLLMAAPTRPHNRGPNPRGPLDSSAAPGRLRPCAPAPGAGGEGFREAVVRGM
jgi:hypothetical protein